MAAALVVTFAAGGSLSEAHAIPHAAKPRPSATADASTSKKGFDISAGTQETPTTPEQAPPPASGTGTPLTTCAVDTEFGSACTERPHCSRNPGSPTGWSSTTVGAPTAPGIAGQVVLGVCNGPNDPVIDPIPGAVATAFARVPVPAAVLSIQPPKGKTLLGLETIFSTTTTPFTRNLTLLGRRIQLRITPTTFVWHHGDGSTQSTDWAGRAWDGNDDMDRYLTHTYEHTGTVHPSVTVTWTATWRIGNSPWRAVDGTVTKAGINTDLNVVEAEPELVAP